MKQIIFAILTSLFLGIALPVQAHADDWFSGVGNWYGSVSRSWSYQQLLPELCFWQPVWWPVWAAACVLLLQHGVSGWLLQQPVEQWVLQLHGVSAQLSHVRSVFVPELLHDWLLVRLPVTLFSFVPCIRVGHFYFFFYQIYHCSVFANFSNFDIHL